MMIASRFTYSRSLFFIFIIAIFFSTSLLQGNSVEKMKNLELKVQLNQEALNHLITKLAPFYAETLYQTDTYFVTQQDRLKLREEEEKEAYLIRYQRPDQEEAKESSYLFYPIKDVPMFLTVLGDSLKKEIQVKKQRALYFPKPHIRLHLDQVENLGDFLEIEIVLHKEVPLAVAEAEMQALEEWLNLKNFNKIHCGYRELLQEKINQLGSGF